MKKIAVTMTFDDDGQEGELSYGDLWEAAWEIVGQADFDDFDHLEFSTPCGDNEFTSDKILAAIEEYSSEFETTQEQKNSLVAAINGIIFSSD